jgi:hypothetical protein
VQAQQCDTCIYKPDCALDVQALERQIADKFMPGYFRGSRTCHHSCTAVCRGFWNRHKDHFTAGQIAQRLGLVEFVHDDKFRNRRAR